MRRKRWKWQRKKEEIASRAGGRLTLRLSQCHSAQPFSLLSSSSSQTKSTTHSSTRQNEFIAALRSYRDPEIKDNKLTTISSPLTSPTPRRFSSTPRSLVPVSPSSASPRPPTTPKPKSATSLFYRQLVPSMLHCLALGSIVYYALELVHMNLEREIVADELSLKVEELEAQLEEARKPPTEEQGKSWRKGWWFW